MKPLRHVPARASRGTPLVILGVAAVGFVVWMLHNFTRQWFVLDEFDYVGPTGGQSYWTWLVAPHNEHTILSTKLWYSALYRAFGYDHYWLYALPLLIGHVALVAGVYRLLARTTGSPTYAAVGALPVLAMGGAYGTLAWPGQAQYTCPIAVGVWCVALTIDDRRSRRVPAWVFAVLALAGTFSGSAFLPFAAVTGLALLWLRRVVPGLLLAGIPSCWFVLERLLWDLPSQYGATGVTDLLRNGPKFAWAVLDKAVSDTLVVTGFGAVAVAFVVWGVATTLHTRPLSELEASRHWAVLLLTGITVVTLLALMVSRLHFGTSPSGGHSYLVLAPFLPLAALLPAPWVIGGRLGFRLGCAAVAAYLVVTSLATMKVYAHDIGGLEQQNRTRLEGAAALTDDSSFEVLDEDLEPGPPGGAPGFDWRRVSDVAREGKLTKADPDPATRDAISLNVQWAAQPYRRTHGDCLPTSGAVSVSDGTVLTSETATTFTLHYPGTSAARTIRLGAGVPKRLVSTAGRTAEIVPTTPVAFQVCRATAANN